MRSRDLIDTRGRSSAWMKRALAHLVREAGARPVTVRGHPVAHRLPDGRTVCVKRRFITQGAADAVLATVNELIGGTHKKPRRTYLCPHCHGWHVTSTNGLK